MAEDRRQYRQYRRWQLTKLEYLSNGEPLTTNRIPVLQRGYSFRLDLQDKLAYITELNHRAVSATTPGHMSKAQEASMCYLFECRENPMASWNAMRTAIIVNELDHCQPKRSPVEWAFSPQAPSKLKR